METLCCAYNLSKKNSHDHQIIVLVVLITRTIMQDVGTNKDAGEAISTENQPEVLEDFITTKLKHLWQMDA